MRIHRVLLGACVTRGTSLRCWEERARIHPMQRAGFGTRPCVFIYRREQIRDKGKVAALSLRSWRRQELIDRDEHKDVARRPAKITIKRPKCFLATTTELCNNYVTMRNGTWKLCYQSSNVFSATRSDKKSMTRCLKEIVD